MSAFNSLKHYFSLVKFSHTVFAMPFAFIGFTLAVSKDEYFFNLRLFLLIILCMVFARNAAMSFNRIADRKFDALNPRTMNREIPSGIISTKAAVIFVIINVVFFIATAGLINRLTLLLSPVAMIIVLGYSLTKRFTALCHFILGLGLSLAPIGAYIAVTGRFDFVPLIFSLTVITWVGGFDIIYSLQDDEFDKSNNLYSLPSYTGRKGALLISIAAHLITFFSVVAAGIMIKAGVLYWIGTLLFTVLLIYQHSIVKSDDISRVNMAFGTTNGLAGVLFSFFVILDLASGKF